VEGRNRRKDVEWTPRCFNTAVQLQAIPFSRQALTTMPTNRIGAKKKNNKIE